MHIPGPSYQKLQNEIFDRIMAEGCSVLEASLTNDQQLKASKVLMKAMAREISKLVSDSYKPIASEIRSEELCSPPGDMTADEAEKIEKRNKTQFTLDELRSQFLEWLGTPYRGYVNNWSDHIVTHDDSVTLIIYTERYEYFIRATTGGYLGCISSCRTPRPGEDWTRGSDLPDGRFNEETWNKIIGSIVTYEALPVVRPVWKLKRYNKETEDSGKQNISLNVSGNIDPASITKSLGEAVKQALKQPLSIKNL